MRSINEIIVHCTATKDGVPFTVADIDRCHRLRGFYSIGYHFVVYLDGSVHQGRPIEKIGAHCLGHNNHSIGVCYVGGLDKDGKPKDTRTPEQRKALTALLHSIKHRFPGSMIRGHRDFAAKACPCFDATKEYADL